MRKFIFPVLLASVFLLSGCNSEDENSMVSAGINIEESSESQTVQEDEINTETENIKEVESEKSEETETVSDIENNVTSVTTASEVVEITQGTESTTTDTDSLKVEKLYISEDTITVKVDESAQITYEVIPREAEIDFSWSSTDVTIASVDSEGNVTGVSEGACTIMIKDKNNPEISKSIHVKVEKPVDKSHSHSINGVTNLTYISGILVANKTYALPSDYDPGVDEEAMAAFTEMQQAAKQEGCNLYIASGYRSYFTQKDLYEKYVQRDGKFAADTYSARPGHSEHQTGLAFDLNSIDASFANTPEGKWVAENCYKYGFIIRYPADKTAITGYMYEPWHIRYLGVNLATSVYQSGLCLEEYLGITSFYEDDTQYNESVEVTN